MSAEAVGGAAKVTVLIVDDEPIARASLRDMLAPLQWIACVGDASDGEGAVRAIRALHPDLVFLDIQMPGGSGLDVIGQCGSDAYFVFTTAFDEFALTAFELGALDYLHKPFGAERVARAAARARAQLAGRHSLSRASDPERETESSLHERLAQAMTPARPLTRLFVRERGAVIPVRISDVVRLEADSDYVAIYAGGKRHLLYMNLGDLAGQLDPVQFVRVHRSHVVNLDYVRGMVPYDAGRLEVRMHDGSCVVASRTGTRELRQRIG